MSNPLLNPSASPTIVKPRRLNKLPVMIVSLLALSVFLGFMYMLKVNNDRHKKRTDDGSTVAAGATADANSFLAGKPTSGAIGGEKTGGRAGEKDGETALTKEQIQAAKDRAAKVEPSLEEKERLRIAAEKRKKLEEAVNAPTAAKNKGGAGASSSVHGQTAANAVAALAAHKTGDPLANLDRLEKIKAGLAAGMENEADANGQEQKNGFLEKQSLSEYLPHTRTAQRSPLEVKTGTVIPATMLSGLNSDLPGMILAQVSQNVYDTASGQYLLIPQGTRLVGKYDSHITYGQSRALVVWNRLVYPDGSTVELAGMPGTDQGGFAGLEDQVDHHFFRIFGTALLMSVITGTYEYTQNDAALTGDKETVGDTLGNAAARELTQTSQMLLRKNLNIQPTIVIRQGYKLNVMVNRDVIFPEVWEGS